MRGRVRERDWKRIAAAWILLLCALVYAVRGYYQQEHKYRSYDFKTVYGSSRCLLKGCDPYDSQQILRVYLEAGGPGDDLRPFLPHEAIYLPPALAMLVPFAILPWGPAHLLWLAVSTGVFLAGVALMGRLCLPHAPLLSAAVIGFLLLSSTMLMMLAQPAQLTVGLCAIAVWCLLEDRFVGAGIVCFAVALAFKPHVIGWVWLYFLLSAGEHRKQAIRVLLVVIVVSAPGLLWASMTPASSRWLHEIPANLAAMAAPGMTNDPGPLNTSGNYIADLQSVISVFRDEPAFYNQVAHALGIVLLGLWLVPVFVMRASRERDYFALASIVCISLLPVYHRLYDSCILIMIFPAFALMTSRGLRSRLWTLAFTLGPLAVLTHVWTDFARYNLAPRIAAGAALGAWQTVLLVRPVPLGLLILAAYYLACLYAAMQRERAALRRMVLVAA
jgi:hypothetical protein